MTPIRRVLPSQPGRGGCDPEIDDIPDVMPEEAPAPVETPIPVEIPVEEPALV